MPCNYQSVEVSCIRENNGSRKHRERKQAYERLMDEMNFENLWKAVVIFQCYPFRMCRGLRYSYTLKRKLDGSYGDELFFSRKEKSIIHSTVERTYRMVMKMDRKVSGPKNLGVFGASIYTRYFCSLG